MKTEEAPEKIYIGNNGDQYYFYLTNPNGDSVEYTRTDAFIEKAEKWMKTFLDTHYVMRYGDCCEPANDVVLEGFRNYMKG